LIDKVRAALKAVASEEVADSHARFFKERPKLLGINTPTLRKIAKEFLDLPLDAISKLLKSSYQEERFLALIILCHRYKKEAESTYNYYLKHLDYIDNWNLVDVSAHEIVGRYLMEKDKSLLKELAASSNMWHRRVAIVATWAFIKKGRVQETGVIAELLLDDPEDLIHKAVGWMLRESGKKDLAFLEKFLHKHHQKMPRTMLRYAIERLSPEERAIWMKIHK
jgi:3-methyladenine DNA glycosylase AlkD